MGDKNAFCGESLHFKRIFLFFFILMFLFKNEQCYDNGDRIEKENQFMYFLKLINLMMLLFWVNIHELLNFFDDGEIW